MIKSYVTMLMPGIFMSEESSREVRVRDIVMSVSNNVFGYYFYDVEQVVSNGEVLKGEKKNVSGTYYPSGKVYSLDEIKQRNNPDDRNLISLMEDEGCKVVQTRLGNWQPFYSGKDMVV